jgi:ketosteroid isomerase-like protein
MWLRQRPSAVAKDTQRRVTLEHPVSEPPTTAQLIEAIREGALFGEGTRLEGTDGIEVMASVLEENAHPDYTTVMVAKAVPPTEYFGVEGFRQALTDWISPYEDFRLEIDEVITQDDALVFLVHQVGTTKHGGVDVEVQSASVWALLDGKIRQTTFYLDQREALEAVGIDPDRSRRR